MQRFRLQRECRGKKSQRVGSIFKMISCTEAKGTKMNTRALDQEKATYHYKVQHFLLHLGAWRCWRETLSKEEWCTKGLPAKVRIICGVCEWSFCHFQCQSCGFEDKDGGHYGIIRGFNLHHLHWNWELWGILAWRCWTHELITICHVAFENQGHEENESFLNDHGIKFVDHCTLTGLSTHPMFFKKVTRPVLLKLSFHCLAIISDA
jgi:hypothetical protein